MKIYRSYLLKHFPEESHDKVIPVLNRVWFDNGCWFIHKDWSHYSTIEKEPGHRFIFKCKFPNIDITGLLICHTCDRRGCINPDHLFKGTPSDNMHDAIKKGRLIRNYKAQDKELIELKKQYYRWKCIQWL